MIFTYKLLHIFDMNMKTSGIKSLSLKKIILPLLLVLACSSSTFGQAPFTIKLKFNVEQGGLENALITITKNGAHHRTIDPNKGKYNIDLDLNAEYLFTFTKPGHITKSIVVDTHVPNGREDEEYAKFIAEVNLNLQPPDQIVTYSQPVGRIKYSNAKYDFDFDNDYTSTAQAQQKKDEANAKPKPKEPVPVPKKEEKPVVATPPQVSNPEPVAIKPPVNEPVKEAPKPVEKDPEPVYAPVVKDKEERVIQKDRLKITIIIVTINGINYEYKKEEYSWGGVYCYRDGNNISERTFDKETE
jgi:hypothetical protein